MTGGRTRLLGTSVAFALTAVTACGWGSGRDSLEVVVDTPDRLEAVNSAGHTVVVDWAGPDIYLPLDHFVLFPVSYANDILDRAIDKLVEACMADKGIVFDFGDRPQRQVETLHIRRYGLTDLASASEFGYRLPPGPPELEALRAAQGEPLPPETELALSGESDESGLPTGHGGCMAEGATAIFGEDPTAGESFGRVQTLANSTLTAATAESKVEDALDAWRQCLSDRGRPTSLTPMELPIPWLEEPRPLGDEIDAAVADIECKRQSRLVEVWATAEAELQATIYEHNKEMLEASRADQLEVLRRATDVLGIELSPEFLEYAGVADR